LITKNKLNVGNSIIGRIILIFGLLIAVIIISAFILIQQEQVHFSQRIDEKLNNTLEVATAILNNESGRLEFVSALIREKNTVFNDFLENDKIRPLQIILQTIASVHKVDFLFLFDENGNLLTSSHVENEPINAEIYKTLISDPSERVGIEKIDSRILKELMPEQINKFDQHESALCFKSVIHQISYFGDIFAYIVVVKTINNNTPLIDKITEITGSDIIFYNLNKQNILSSFSSKSLPYPSKGSTSYGFTLPNNNSYFSRSKQLSNFKGEIIGELTVAENNSPFVSYRQKRLIYSLLPFLGTVSISIILFILLKVRVFDKINQLAYVLRRVTEKDGNLGMRLQTGVRGQKHESLDEVETIIINFNQMMEKLEGTYNQLTETNEILNRLIEESPFGIMMIDKNKQIFRINNAGAAIFNRPKEKILNQICHNFVCPRKVGDCPVGVDGHSINQLETIALTGNDSSTPIIKSAIKVEDFILEAFIDITDIKKAKEETEKAREAAEEANKTKSNFLANMSHEIRTPMNAIIGITELALNHEITPKIRNYLRTIQTSADSLLGIINDILDFSKIEAGKLDMERVEFLLREHVFDILVDLFYEKGVEKGLEFHIDIADEVPNFLTGDSLRLRQILINLITNAFKFTEQGEIHIKAECINKTSSQTVISFSVRDTGIGLTEAQKERLFTSFSQADTSHTRKYGGTGLGLTICKKLVELMNGEMHLESQKGQGSTFHFTAQFQRQTKIRNQELLLPSSLNGMKILVVDDNPVARRITKNILSSFFFEVETATSGKEAIELLKNDARGKKSFRLVMMDWKMEGMDGFETINAIGKIPELSDISIIMNSAFANENEIDIAESKGIPFLRKPLKKSLLFNCIMDTFGEDNYKISVQEKAVFNKLDAAARLKGAKILLVEDNSINQQVATELLESAFIEVDLAENGSEAVTAVNKTEYDLVLMDIQMPYMDGYEATRIIRKHSDPSKDLPIIAMTAHAMKGDREKSLKSGMNDHITKPIRIQELFNTLAKWIKEIKNPVLEKDIVQKNILPKQNPVDPDFPESIPGIDITAGLQIVNHNYGLLKKLLQEFAVDYPGAADKIGNMIENNDHESARILAHTIKGIAGNLGAGQLYFDAQALEDCLKNNEMTEAELLFAKFSEELTKVILAINKFLPAELDKTPVKTTPINIPEIWPDILRLAELLNESDMNAEEHLNSFKFKFDTQQFHPKLQELEKLINDLDFIMAGKCLAEIMKEIETSD
jgi:signal transduction histidine kinase/DNA-binding response OmpR family regulator/HPt (histidine-containing phosphotransfer) domain-containing protein